MIDEFDVTFIIRRRVKPLWLGLNPMIKVCDPAGNYNKILCYTHQNKTLEVFCFCVKGVLMHSCHWIPRWAAAKTLHTMTSPVVHAWCLHIEVTPCILLAHAQIHTKRSSLRCIARFSTTGQPSSQSTASSMETSAWLKHAEKPATGVVVCISLTLSHTKTTFGHITLQSDYRWFCVKSFFFGLDRVWK